MKKYAVILLSLILVVCVICSCTDKQPTESNAGEQTQTGTSDSSQDTSSGSGADASPTQNTDPQYKINSFYDLNKNENKELSHANSANAALELDRRSVQRLDFKLLKTTTVYYPRLKLMADGNYILFYQEGNHGDTIYYITSSDLENWSAPTELFVHEEQKDIKYATCDAVVLDNGEILAVCSYREGSDYDEKPHLNGIVMKKSSDNAKTWSEQKKIYVGTTWEPYPMQLSTGEVQVYFTNTTCYYNTAVADASTGTAMVRSLDRGATWTGDLSVPYSAQIVSQTPTRVSAGQQLYSDQMPVGIELLGSKKLMLALETRLDKEGNYRISLSYSPDNWAKPLAVNEQGPTEKQSKAWTGAAPYLRQFISGEVVCAYTRKGLLSYRMLDFEGKKYSGTEYQPFDGISGSYWGAVELIGSHTLVGIGESFNKVTITRTENTIDYGKLNLNHAIAAAKMTPNLDGAADDWKTNDEALFIGSMSQAQASVRAAQSDKGICFMVERLDDYLDEKNDTVLIYFAQKGSDGYYRVTVGCSGVVGFDRFDGKKFVSLDKSGVEFAKKVNGTVGYDEDTDHGYSVEVCVLSSALSEKIDNMCICLNLQNSDKAKKSELDTLSGVDIAKKDTWIDVSFN